MIVRFAIRSLAVRPVRTTVLACGFGLGIAVMAELLGVGEVILDQARSPALRGGGDLVMSGLFGDVTNARFVLANTRRTAQIGARITALSPSKKATLYLMRPGAAPLPVSVHGGVPSGENGVGDPETAGRSVWVDTPEDRRWIAPGDDDVLRAMDRFHRQPAGSEFASSWAEWLYFNGRTADGSVRFYLTFLAGPVQPDGQRRAGVRLQLDRQGRVENYSASGTVSDSHLVAGAPDLDIAANQVRLEHQRYKIHLHLRGEHSVVEGDLVLQAQPGRSLPPTIIRGARGWLSGYTVPVLSGRLDGTLEIDGSPVSFSKAIGYHDHNWGFWQDVTWQWGQVAHDDLSFVYGRVFPPSSVADPERMPGFLGVLGPDGPLGVSTDVKISEERANGEASAAAPRTVTIDAHGRTLDLTMRFAVDGAIRTADFLQLSGAYRVNGEVAGHSLDFTSRGAAETWVGTRRWD